MQSNKPITSRQGKKNNTVMIVTTCEYTSTTYKCTDSYLFMSLSLLAKLHQIGFNGKALVKLREKSVREQITRENVHKR